MTNTTEQDLIAAAAFIGALTFTGAQAPTPAVDAPLTPGFNTNRQRIRVWQVIEGGGLVASGRAQSGIMAAGELLERATDLAIKRVILKNFRRHDLVA